MKKYGLLITVKDKNTGNMHAMTETFEDKYSADVAFNCLQEANNITAMVYYAVKLY